MTSSCRACLHGPPGPFETIPQVDPTGEDEDEPQYTADAIAVDDRGILFLYSRQDSSVTSPASAMAPKVLRTSFNSCSE